MKPTENKFLMAWAIAIGLYMLIVHPVPLLCLVVGYPIAVWLLEKLIGPTESPTPKAPLRRSADPD